MNIIERVRRRLIEDCRAEWRKFSTWITAVALAIWGAFTAFPSLAVEAWRALPPEWQSMIPHQREIALACFAAILVAKFVKQKAPGE